MSTGGWVGAVVGLVVGAVIGFFVGGGPGGAVMGAIYGASLGFSLGMYLDPMTPDVPSTTAPLPGGSEIMTTIVGDPLPDLLGTAKITGHLLCFGKERTETIYSDSGGGGKGGGSDPDPQVSGYEYYMSWAVGIVAGPATTLYTVYRNDDVVWEGELSLPSSGGQETIVLDGMGSAIFYFGTDDQVANPDVGDIIGDDTLNSPYRHFCWCFLDDCCIGDYNRCPTMKFILRKTPEIAFSGNNVIQTYDYNPMHAIWYILHNLTGLPETWLHTDDFISASSTLYNNSRGISCLFISQQSAMSYLENINNHIDGILRYGSDGKFHPKLIRDDYVVDDLPLIDESVMLDDPTLKRKSWSDTINEIKVQYTEILGTYSFLQGPWKAAMSPQNTSFIYVYDITYKSVIKLNTNSAVPVCQDAFVITENDLDYDMGYGNPGAQRGGYCMDPNGNRLWYLMRDGVDCELVEVDISDYYIEVANRTDFSSLLAVGEKINDSCSDGTYTYWCTNLIAGRVIKIRNSDHSISIDTTFNYPLMGGGGGFDSGIESIEIHSNELFWIYSRDHDKVLPRYSACRHWVRSGTDLSEDFDRVDCGSAFSTPGYQNLIRYHDGHIFIHRAYHPGCGFLHVTDSGLGIGMSECAYYLQNIIGVTGGNAFLLEYFAPYTTTLKCVDLPALGELKSRDVSKYTGHPHDDSRTWTSTSALSSCGLLKIVTLFTYDEVNKVNRLTCFRADETLTRISEGEVQNNTRIKYGD